MFYLSDKQSNNSSRLQLKSYAVGENTGYILAKYMLKKEKEGGGIFS